MGEKKSKRIQFFVITTNLSQFCLLVLYGHAPCVFYVNIMIVFRGNVALRQNQEAKQKAHNSHTEI